MKPHVDFLGKPCFNILCAGCSTAYVVYEQDIKDGIFYCPRCAHDRTTKRAEFAEYFLNRAEQITNAGVYFNVGIMDLERMKREFENGFATK